MLENFKLIALKLLKNKVKEIKEVKSVNRKISVTNDKRHYFLNLNNIFEHNGYVHVYVYYISDDDVILYLRKHESLFKQ